MKAGDIRYEDFTWKNNKLYLNNKPTGFSIFHAEEDMYWLKWPDGVISADYYNLTRAKDNCVLTTLSYFNSELSKSPAEAPPMRLNSTPATTLA